jgi:Trp operon repressor
MAQPNWIQKQFVDLIKKVSRDKRNIHELLSIILTPKEYEECARRLEIMRALDRGVESQRTIAERLHVAIATVTRSSNEYQRNKDKISMYLHKIPE